MDKQEVNSLKDSIQYLQRLAIEGQSKFLYFLVGLTFAILGLSLQTTRPVTWVTQISWVMLLSSGLVGIFRIESDPKGRMMESYKLTAEYFKLQFKEARIQGRGVEDESTGDPVPVDEAINKQAVWEKMADERVKKIFWEQEWRYKIQMWAFILGVIGLAVDKIFAFN